MIVADTSLMISWLLNETDVVVAEDVYNLLAEETLLVPAHWPVEIGNALAVNVRRGRISPELLNAIQAAQQARGCGGEFSVAGRHCVACRFRGRSKSDRV